MSEQHLEAVPFFRPMIEDAEIAEVVDCLRSGWITTGPKTKQFEKEFGEFVGAKHTIAVNSCTAGLHLALAGLKVKAGDGILVPTWTFAATAEVVQYLGGIPILVDCEDKTFFVDLKDAERKIQDAKSGALPIGKVERVVGIMPVHVGGAMLDMDLVREFADRHGLWVVEDAAHSFPARYHSRSSGRSLKCGEKTADVTCFSFYANKTITTGEGGMIATDSDELAEQMRCLSLHGLSSLAWNRFSNPANWDYQILSAGFKYNLTDIASAIGIHQLRKAENLRQMRQEIAETYLEGLAGIDLLELPENDPTILHSWHLFPIRLKLEQLSISRNDFCNQLRQAGIGFSVHWRPLHLHPLYSENWGWRTEHASTASSLWPRVVSLPIFAGMTKKMVSTVIGSVSELLSAARIA